MAERTTWGVSPTNPTIIKQFDALGETGVLIGSSHGYPNSGFFPTDEEAKANALKMAAAPELLEALRPFVDCNFTFFSGKVLGSDARLRREDVDRARAAIAKATGSAA